MEEDKIIIKRSPNADTRTSKGDITKKELLQQTYSHIDDVNNVGVWLADKFKEQIKNHDHTKIEGIDQFYKDFTTGMQNAEFKKLPWWQLHMTERHHLNDSVPEDVNLLDVLEMVIDCTVAGLARGGSADKIYPITIPQEVLELAIDNTKNLIIDNTKLED